MLIRLLTVMLATLTAFLGACVTGGFNEPIVRDVAVAGGFWEQDENTDPRFQRVDLGRRDTIGRLFTVGSRVFLNGRPITGAVPVRNGSTLRTGDNSAARVEFNPSAPPACLIRIQDLDYGKGYGRTAACRHQFQTRQGEGISRQADVEYHLAMSGELTELTVIRGSMAVGSSGNAADKIWVEAFHEALILPGRIIGPRPVAPEEVRRRTAWRDDYDFDKAGARIPRYDPTIPRLRVPRPIYRPPPGPTTIK